MCTQSEERLIQSIDNSLRLSSASLPAIVKLNSLRMSHPCLSWEHSLILIPSVICQIMAKVLMTAGRYAL